MCYYKYHSAWSGNVNIYLLYTCTYHSRANYIFILSFNCSKFSVCLGILMIEFEVLFTVPFMAFLLTVFFIQQRSTYIWIYEYCTSKYSLWLCLYLPSWKEGKPSFHPSSSLSFFFDFPCHSPSSLLYHIYHALLLSFPLFLFLFNISSCLSSTTSWSENATNAMNSYCTEGAHSLEWANSSFCFLFCLFCICVCFTILKIMFILTVVRPTILCTQPSLDICRMSLCPLFLLAFSRLSELSLSSEQMSAPLNTFAVLYFISLVFNLFS